MTLALVHGRARVGVDAPAVQVEVQLAGGLPRMSIVGLPATAVREAKNRVRAAIRSSQFEFPARAITVNLAPADLPKDGGRFDLAIALGILAASGQVPREALNGCEFHGELGLTGELRPVDGILPAALAAGRAGRGLVVPAANAREAALARGVEVRAARTLLEVCGALSGQRTLPAQPAPEPLPALPGPDLADVRGQARARRALEIAAAGGHHLLFVGSPGCGKTLLATRLPGILPDATEDEALEAAAIASAAAHRANGASGAVLDPSRWRVRPFRAPHHSASAVALVGGGAPPRPGEISLAHNGVLFLDELPEWSRHALDTLREPLESGHVVVSRAARQCRFPARFQLVAAMNPCPCGWAGDPAGRCRCPADAIARYRGRVSGPLLDRIDLHVDVARLLSAALAPDAPAGEPSATVRARVESARVIALSRQGVANAGLEPAGMREHCRLAPRDQALLERSIDALQLSARSMQRVLRVARTIADLAKCADIGTAHLTEALGYRQREAAPP